jgi:hypothetical protein
MHREETADSEDTYGWKPNRLLALALVMWECHEKATGVLREDYLKGANRYMARLYELYS